LNTKTVLNKLKPFVLFIFVIYIAIVLNLTIIRFGRFYPERQLNLLLFADLIETYKRYGFWSFTRLFFGNIGWFIPFGFLLPLLLKKESFFKVVVMGFMFSFAIETIQFIFRKGVAELDDLILNTIGVAIGYYFYKLLVSCRMNRPLSSYNALFYHVSIFLRRFTRNINWIFNSQKFAKKIEHNALKYRVYKHQSVLIRKLGGTDLIFQRNKVDNLIIAIKKLNGIIVRPGETFSFCYLVGHPTKKKGYKEGILLCNGEAKPGIGGGLCQISNLIHWLCLHSPLTITERHHHSFDPFPDEGR